MDYTEPDVKYDEAGEVIPGLTPEQARLAKEHTESLDLANGVEFEKRKIKAHKIAKEAVETEEAAGRPLTWTQVDHESAFHMARNRIQPDIGHMTETPSSPPLPLFYTGKINGVHGDSEAGKSWLMLYVSVQEMTARRHVMYVDFEDDAGGVYGRLLDLGMPEAGIVEYFHYVNPLNKMTLFEQLEWQKLIAMDAPHSLAVIDGVTEAMSLENLTGRDEGEVAKWHSLVTKPLAAAGWGVGMIDHTPHNETRVIGSQHKRSAITGVSYSLDSVTSFAPGQCGKTILRVEKDRPGGIRAEAAPGPRPQWYGTFVLDSTMGPPMPSIWPWKPETEEEDPGDMEPPVKAIRAILGYIKKHPGALSTEIRASSPGVSTKIANFTIQWLVDQGCVRTEAGSRNKIHHHYDHGPE